MVSRDDDLGPERFLREIEIAANLTHPHILPLHDSGEADGFCVLVCPSFNNEALDQREARCLASCARARVNADSRRSANSPFFPCSGYPQADLQEFEDSRQHKLPTSRPPGFRFGRLEELERVDLVHHGVHRAS